MDNEVELHQKPNILLIYTDQQRYDTINALGAEWMHTPNLDRLCREGVAFTQATTPSPVCMPDRWSLNTGQWPSTHQCYSNHHCGPLPEWSLPGLLRDAGYRTGLIGKNHSYLTKNDLDVFNTSPEPADFPKIKERNALFQNRQFARLYQEGAPGGIAGDPEIYKTNAALEFMKEDTRKPFYLWLSYLNPHTPYITTEKYLSLYREQDIPGPVKEPEGLAAADKPFRQQFHQRNNDAVMPFDTATVMRMRRVYYGMVSLIDHEVGRILDFLEETGQRENTILIFTSDHGDYMGDHGLFTKSPALYDCLMRIPFIVSQPGTLPENEYRDDFVSHVDILPTLVNISGETVPDGVEGKDFLRNRGDVLRPGAYGEYGMPGRPYSEWSLGQAGYAGKTFTNPGDDGLPWEGNPVALSGPIRMIRTREWKLIIEDEGTSELYDLNNDPHELTNLYNTEGLETKIRELTELINSSR